MHFVYNHSVFIGFHYKIVISKIAFYYSTPHRNGWSISLVMLAVRIFAQQYKLFASTGNVFQIGTQFVTKETVTVISLALKMKESLHQKYSSPAGAAIDGSKNSSSTKSAIFEIKIVKMYSEIVNCHCASSCTLFARKYGQMNLCSC